MFLTKHISRYLSNRRAQLLLPAVLLLPLFVLVIYLLIETTKVSIAKVRHQFALDNAAYTQVSSVSTFLNAVGLLNGPLPYRVLKTYDDDLTPVNPQDVCSSDLLICFSKRGPFLQWHRIMMPRRARTPPPSRTLRTGACTTSKTARSNSRPMRAAIRFMTVPLGKRKAPPRLKTRYIL